MNQRDERASDPKNLRLVVAIAKSVHQNLPPSFDLDDLIAVGNVALLSAAERYDTSRSVPFPIFARQVIRGAMLDSCRRKNWAENTRASIDDQGDAEFEGEYADIEKYGPEGQRALFRAATRPTPEISIDNDRLKARLAEAIDQLPGEQRIVLMAAFFDELSIREIGIRFGITRGRARKLRTDAIAALKRELTAQEKAKS